MSDTDTIFQAMKNLGEKKQQQFNLKREEYENELTIFKNTSKVLEKYVKDNWNETKLDKTGLGKEISYLVIEKLNNTLGKNIIEKIKNLPTKL